MTRGYAAIGLCGPKIEENVGGAMRAASCYDARLILMEAPRFTHRATNVTQAQRHIPIDTIKYQMNPRDMWFADLSFAPREERPASAQAPSGSKGEGQ